MSWVMHCHTVAYNQHIAVVAVYQYQTVLLCDDYAVEKMRYSLKKKEKTILDVRAGKTNNSPEVSIIVCD